MNAAARDLALKAASGDLVSELGGIEAAASYLECGKSPLGRKVNRNDPDHFLSVRDVASLERLSANPHVTRRLCRMAGGVFVALPECHGADDSLPMQMMEVAREMGEVSGAITEGLRDGAVSPAEAHRALDELHDLESCTAKLRLMLQALAEKL